MSLMVIYERLSQIEVDDAYKGITKWFKDNPRRKVCRCDYFNVRRGYVAETLLEHAKKGVTLEGKK